MNKFVCVFKHEYKEVVKKKSFVVGLIVTPLFMAAVTILPTLLVGMGSSSPEYLAIIDQSGQGIGQELADSLGTYMLDDSIPAYVIDSVVLIGREDSARFAKARQNLVANIDNEVLKYGVVIGRHPEVADTNMAIVTNSDNFQAIRRIESRLTQILSSIRVSQSQVNLPVDSVLSLTRRVSIPLKDTTGDAIPFFVKYLAAIGFTLMAYVMIFAYGTLLMRSVIEEKSSRVIEVLVSSVSPAQLLLGKIVGLGLAGLTQLAIWVACGLVLFFMSGSIGIDIDAGVGRIVFNPMIVASFVLFFLAGYFLYSIVFALIGSICNTDKEAQNFIFPIVMCLILPMIIGISVAQGPDQAWVRVLSMIPLFSPTLMVMRVLIVAPVETQFSLFSGILSEAALSFVILCVSSVVLLWIASKVFRIGILMYGKRPTLPEIIRWVRQS